MANNWTREQLIVTFNLYCKIPFAKAVQTNPDVIEVAHLIGRSPGAVAFKLGNFGSFDPELKKRGIGGLPNTSKLDKEIWNEFNSNWDELAFQSELLIAQFANKPVEETSDIEIVDLPEGLDRMSLVKARVNQGFFRRSVLNIYGGRCCITGIGLKELLVASHIVPWAKDISNRTNPQNGLCLNVLHDKAFDKGLLTIMPDFTIKLSTRLLHAHDSEFIDSYFRPYDGKSIAMPEKFVPHSRFLSRHNRDIFHN